MYFKNDYVPILQPSINHTKTIIKHILAQIPKSIGRSVIYY